MSKKSNNKALRNAAAISGASIGTLAVGAALTYFGTKLLVNTALDRTPPRVMKKANGLISGSAKNSPVPAEALEAAENLRNSENRIIETVAHDGTRLVGHYIPCENAERLIIAVHGWRSSWDKDFGLISDFFRNNGCSVLYVEQRGQNNSGGDYMGFGLVERYDCIDWVHAAKEQLNNELPVYLCGVSMGAATVLMASGDGLPEEVHGIIADCGFTSPEEIWHHIARKNLHVPYITKKYIADAMCKHKLLVGANEYSTVTALKNAKVPVLFIHGSADKFVPIEMTYKNYAACASPKDLLVVPGAGHALSYYVEPVRYEETVKRFWSKYDK